MDDTWVSDTCKKIVKVSKDQNDLELRLSKFTADKLLGFYKPKKKPLAPGAYTKYRAWDDKRRKEYDKENPGWKEEDEPQRYIRKASEVDAENQSHVIWLQRCMTYDIGADRKDKIQQTLNLFNVNLRLYTTQRPHSDPEVEKVREQFSGIVGGVE